MTTTVKVITHDWPVEVTITDKACQGEACSTQRVEPKSEREFHLTDTRSIGLVELAKPEAIVEPDAEISTAISEDGTVLGVSV